jgi:MazG family protein
MKRLIDIVDRLRSEGGCPWDREQTLYTLKQHLVEECYELIDAIDSGDADRHRDELGDILLQVLMQSRIREEEGSFTFDDVATTLADKLVRRHPHVFADGDAKTPKQVLRKWEQIKASEKREGERSAGPDVPRHLPALMKAQRVQERASRVGFDWQDISGVVEKVEEELVETRACVEADDSAALGDELGDLLFAVVNLCRFSGINAEETLSSAVSRFTTRFRRVEQRVRDEGGEMSACSPEELNAHWEAVKREE